MPSRKSTTEPSPSPNIFKMSQMAFEVPQACLGAVVSSTHLDKMVQLLSWQKDYTGSYLIMIYCREVFIPWNSQHFFLKGRRYKGKAASRFCPECLTRMGEAGTAWCLEWGRDPSLLTWSCGHSVENNIANHRLVAAEARLQSAVILW